MLRRLCEKPTRSVFSHKPKRTHVGRHTHADYHSMRVEASANPPQGSVIGKALEAWDEGTATIKMLALFQ